MSEVFSLTDEQWSRLVPLLPNDTRGVPRVDDRRVISGFVHVLKSGGRWADAPKIYGSRKTLYNRFVRRAAKGVWLDFFSYACRQRRSLGRRSPRECPCQRTSLRGRRKREERSQAIGCSRGGRTTKIHALSDGQGRPLRFVLTGGHVADCRVADHLLSGLPIDTLVLADKAYDTDAIRRQIEDAGAISNIPPKANRTWKSCFSPQFYRERNVIESVFGRIMYFRPIAKCYDKIATNFLSAVVLTAAVIYWL